MQVFYNQSLKSYNTFGVEALAKEIIFLENEEDILSLLPWGHNTTIFGGGSNILLLHQVYDRIGIIKNTGDPLVIEEDDKHVIVEVKAGSIRDHFVQWTLNHGYYGLENMGNIPGTIGAGVLGNIGAYGREIGDFVYQVNYIDLKTKEIKTLTRDQCHYSYRRSAFKSLSHYIIVSARFIFHKNTYQLDHHYPDIQHYLAYNAISPQELTPIKLYQIICDIRSNKMPSWDERGTAGSFWKNPLVSKEQLDRIKTIDPLVKSFPYKDHYKLAAGWLLEQLGYKGKIIRTASGGSVGCYKHQALLVVNHEATGKEIDHFARSCEDIVYSSYGVKLEREVISL